MRTIYFAALIAFTQAARQFEELEDVQTDSAYVVETDLEDVELEDIYVGDDDMVEVADVEIDDEEIDMTITETTDIYGNKADKIDYVEFSWDEFAVTDYTFGDLMGLVQNDEQAAALVETFKSNFMDRYKEEVANLPQVCEPGKECRAEILATLRANV